jgi:hypothetical protein
MGAPGDSGGPVFIQDGSTWYIAGVHSFLLDRDRLLAIMPLMGATATFWVPRASRPMPLD